MSKEQKLVTLYMIKPGIGERPPTLIQGEYADKPKTYKRTDRDLNWHMGKVLKKALFADDTFPYALSPEKAWFAYVIDKADKIKRLKKRIKRLEERKSQGQDALEALG